jgi:hypothetical protein
MTKFECFWEEDFKTYPIGSHVKLHYCSMQHKLYRCPVTIYYEKKI